MMKMGEVGGASPVEGEITIGRGKNTGMIILMIIGTEVITGLVMETLTTGRIILN
jgi:hypothetical protein